MRAATTVLLVGLVPLATAFAHPVVRVSTAADREQRRTAVTMKEEEVAKPNLPSLGTALLGLIVVQSGYQLTCETPLVFGAARAAHLGFWLASRVRSRNPCMAGR